MFGVSRQTFKQGHKHLHEPAWKFPLKQRLELNIDVGSKFSAL